MQRPHYVIICLLTCCFLGLIPIPLPTPIAVTAAHAHAGAHHHPHLLSYGYSEESHHQSRAKQIVQEKTFPRTQHPDECTARSKTAALSHGETEGTHETHAIRCN